MKTIPLSRGLEAIVSDEDFELISAHTWHANLGGGGIPYAYTNIRKPDGGYRRVSMHQLLLGGRPRCDIDHINGNGIDNRRENLRHCTHRQNVWNQKSRGGRSQYRGVVYDTGSPRKPWRALLGVGYERYRLGRFRTEIEAALAYDKKAVEVYGEFARLNFPDGPPTIEPFVPRPVIENCAVCGSQFEAKLKNRAKYCSDLCRGRRRKVA